MPIDGSEHADKALNCALDLAEKYNAEIEILNVVAILPTAPIARALYMFTMFTREMRNKNEKMLSDTLLKAKQAKQSLNISSKLVEGRPSTKIIEAAKEGDFEK